MDYPDDLWEAAIVVAADSLYGIDIRQGGYDPILAPPKDLGACDASSSVAFRLAPRLGRTPREIAAELCEKVNSILRGEPAYVGDAEPDTD